MKKYSSSKKNGIRLCVTLLIVTLSLVGLALFIRQPTVWTMINVNSQVQQGDAHLIETPFGQNILIDVGFPEEAQRTLIPFLQSKKIHTIDKVFISHAHIDHYGGLWPLLDSGFVIKELWINIPEVEVCDREIAWGCDVASLQNLFEKLKKTGTHIKKFKPGDRFYWGPLTTLKVLYAFDGVHTPVGTTDVNGTSVILRLKHGKTTVLFTGDLSLQLGEYLARFPQKIHADLLKMPHHGTEILPPNSFFESVNPKAILVPSPHPLWCSNRSQRSRQWVSDHHVPTWTNGESGHVVVDLHLHHFEIKPEHPPTPGCH